MRIPYFLRAILFLLFFPGLLSPAAAVPARDIVIAQSVDLSGPLGYIGQDYLTGAKVYFDHVNASGGINGRKITHLVMDNAGSTEKSAHINQQFLLSGQKIDAFFGYFGEGSLETLLSNGAFKSSGIPLLAPLSGGEAGEQDKNVFFIRPGFDGEAVKLAGPMLSSGLTRVAVVYSANNDGKSALKAVEAMLAGRNMKLAGKYPIMADGSGLDAAIKAAFSTRPQAIILALDTLPAAQFVKNYRRLDAGAFMLGLSRIDHKILFDIAGKDLAAGVMIAQVVPHPGDWKVPVVIEHRKIMEIYRDEAPSHLTLEGFIAAKMLVSTMRKLGKDFTPMQLGDALRTSRRMDIGGYYLDFSPSRNRGSSYVDINAISRNGKLLN
ncbi:MAG: ABC transporter substrate-binding protein [Sulfurimicrobium sp.]|jgi:ABC-type branched-subunit amino acid transport system substrate-binding protein|nr:ABC transporter substrate-binding protein [Sulfurimicrobium sp.]MDO9189313.1 ABC transporter substrate-binding protein [Sulfurimicrobium sp.]MDP1705932.1 ABC transporter substrate-binding protein [Sulfurimicrobium sp.]MDP2197877.1 ABC transporter substrate-binding protein [Sulfurimicrobium sp.]MDP2962753.1 ABC transporter substrate-binding protein [Sulfurimicrobium sp.]